MKPYILDDALTLEYQRLDLMSRILDPWTREYHGAAGGPELLDAVLDDDGRLGAQAASVRTRDFRALHRGAQKHKRAMFGEADLDTHGTEAERGWPGIS